MRIPLYQVDAFTDRLFGGNPAAVCPLAGWLPDAPMQAIAAENNLANEGSRNPVPCRQGKIAGKKRCGDVAGAKIPVFSVACEPHAAASATLAGKRQGNDPSAFLQTENSSSRRKQQEFLVPAFAGSDEKIAK